MVPLIVFASALVGGAPLLWWALRPPPVPVAVLSRRWHRRWRWRCCLGHGLRRLQRLVRPPNGVRLALVVVETLADGRGVGLLQRAGSVHLIVLALATPEGRRSGDEVLAALAAQYLSLAAPPRRPPGPAAGVAPPHDQLGALLQELELTENGSAS